MVLWEFALFMLPLEEWGYGIGLARDPCQTQEKVPYPATCDLVTPYEEITN